MLEEYVHSDVVFLNLKVVDRPMLFNWLADSLFSNGYVTDGFKDFLNKREDNYPTGLQLEGYQVAIPHGDPQYIKKPFVAVVTLNHPINMHLMENADQIILVDTFFVLGLSSGAGHIQLLQAMMQLIQNREFMKQIHTAKTISDIMQAIHDVELKVNPLGGTAND